MNKLKLMEPVENHVADDQLIRLFPKMCVSFCSALNYKNIQNSTGHELEFKTQVIHLEASLKSLTEKNNKLQERLNQEKGLG